MLKQLENDYDLPSENQSIVRVVASKGNNLHEVMTASGESYLASMPTKFRKNIWVKRGDYVLVEPIEEGDKVKGEMVKVLTAETVKYFTKCDVWPKQFSQLDKPIETKIVAQGDNSSDDDLFVNTNRPVRTHEYTDSSSDEDSSDDDGGK